MRFATRYRTCERDEIDAWMLLGLTLFPSSLKAETSLLWYKTSVVLLILMFWAFVDPLQALKFVFGGYKLEMSPMNNNILKTEKSHTYCDCPFCQILNFYSNCYFP